MHSFVICIENKILMFLKQMNDINIYESTVCSSVRVHKINIVNHNKATQISKYTIGKNVAH